MGSPYNLFTRPPALPNTSASITGPGVSLGRAAISATAPAATRGKAGSTTIEHILDCLLEQGGLF